MLLLFPLISNVFKKCLLFPFPPSPTTTVKYCTTPTVLYQLVVISVPLIDLTGDWRGGLSGYACSPGLFWLYSESK